jgi:hypothetical protein
MEPGEFSKSELTEGQGGCDALVLLSILFPEDGSYSMLPATKDGRTGNELSAKEMFKAWMLLGDHISQMSELDEGRKIIAETPIQMMRTVMDKEKTKEN